MTLKNLSISTALLLSLIGCATTGDLEETRRQLDQVNRQASTRLSEVETKLANERLLEMVGQLDALKAEVTKLNGELELLKHDLQNTQKRQNDLYNDLDTRLSPLEGNKAPTAAPAAKIEVEADVVAEYDKALALLRARDFTKAVNALRSFVQKNPQVPQAAEAHYWLGVAHTALRQYDLAIDIHRRFAEQNPQHALAPEALRNVANCQRSLEQQDAARATYNRLIKLYPKSESAQKARQELAKM